jgi:phosphate-selective porin
MMVEAFHPREYLREVGVRKMHGDQDHEVRRADANLLNAFQLHVNFVYVSYFLTGENRTYNRHGA